VKVTAFFIDGLPVIIGEWKKTKQKKKKKVNYIKAQ